MWELFKAENSEVSKVYPSQKETAIHIQTQFVLGKQFVTLIAQFQWGKTGTILELVINMCTHPDESISCLYTNVFILTGMSDLDWKEQTKNRMPHIFHENILHLPDIKKNVEKLSQARDALIIIDECQIANGDKQTIAKVFQDSGLLNTENLLKRNIKIVQVSATPDNALYDTKHWGDKHEKVFGKIPESYLSLEEIVNSGRFFSKLDLKNPLEVNNLCEKIKETFDTNKYHLIRSVVGDTYTEIKENFSIICGENNWHLIEYNYDSPEINITETLDCEPSTHTFILIKNKLRAAKSISDIHIGVVHESNAKNKSDSSELQGLLGRMCGHNKIRGPKGPLIFGDYDTVRRYIELHNNDFNFEKSEWKAMKLKSNGLGIVNSKKSYCNHNLISGIEPVGIPIRNKDYEYEIDVFQSEAYPQLSKMEILKAIEQRYKTKIKRKYFTLENQDENGFEKTGMATTEVFTFEQCKKTIIKWGFRSNLLERKVYEAGTKRHRLYVVYNNLEDPSEKEKPIFVFRRIKCINECDFRNIE